VIAVVSSSFSSCKNFNVANFNKSNTLKVINMKLGVLAYHDKVQLLDNRHNSESNIFGDMPLFKFLVFLIDKL
jgi:hypothetical protein